MAQQQTVKRIVIKVDAPGVKDALDKMATSMGYLNKNTKSLATNMGTLSGAFRGWLSYLGVRELANMSDQVQNLQNRLKITTSGAVDAAETFKNLTNVANANYISISAAGDVYNRFAVSLKRVGATSTEVVALTDELLKTFRVAGSGVDETSNAMVQLSQAFSLGTLRGQDLRSVISQNVVIAAALQKRYGPGLFKEAEKGAISITEVLKILKGIQAEVEISAKKLAPTFSQTLTVAMNKATVAVGEFSTSLDLPQKFADVVGFITDHFAVLTTLLAGAAFLLAIQRVFIFVEALQAMAVAGKLFSLSNVFTAAFLAIITAGALIYENWDKVVGLFTKLKIVLLGFAADVEEAFLRIGSKIAGFLGTTLQADTVISAVNNMRSFREEAKKLQAELDSGTAKKGKKLTDAKKYAKALADLTKKSEAAAQAAKSYKGELSELNELYLAHTITISEYNKRLIGLQIKKVDAEFAEGKTDIFKYDEALRDLDIKEFNRQLRKSELTLKQFNTAVSGANLKVLNEQLDAGKISLAEYNAEIIKLKDEFSPGAGLYTGVHSFIESVGTVSEGIAKVTTQAFEHLSDTLTDFIKTGKLDFASFTKAILDDLTAMLVRAAIVAPIAQGILGLFGSAASGAVGAAAGGGFSGSSTLTLPSLGSSSGFANGGIMSSGGPMPLNKYSNGGIANSPQMAMFGEGRTPEAYVPLPDGRSIPVSMDGGGGVSVVQNITVNSDGSTSSSDASTGQKAKQLGDIMKRVALDTIMQQRKPGGLLA